MCVCVCVCVLLRAILSILFTIDSDDIIFLVEIYLKKSVFLLFFFFFCNIINIFGNILGLKNVVMVIKHFFFFVQENFFSRNRFCLNISHHIDILTQSHIPVWANRKKIILFASLHMSWFLFYFNFLFFPANNLIVFL